MNHFQSQPGGGEPTRMRSTHVISESTVNPDRVSDSFLPLLVALVVMLISLPLLEPLPLLMPAVASLVLVAGLLAVLRDRSFRAVVIGALVVCLPLRWGAQFWGNSIPVLILMSHVAVGISFAILEVVVLVRVIAQPQVNRQSVIGAICGYLILGFLFTFAYTVLTYCQPDAIAVGGQPLGAEQVTNIDRHVADLLYFSFITLATVGYGDIVPISPAARSMVILEALAGQLYLAAFVARLIGAMSAPSSDPRSRN